MAKAAKKKAKTPRKPARVAAKSKIAKKPTKPAKKASRRIDPLNRKNYTAISPVLTVRDIRTAVGFYTAVLGFKVRNIMEGPQGAVHAELRLRDATLMLSPESAERQNFSANSIGKTPITLYALVEDADAAFKRAVSAGAKVVLPVANMFWGDRGGVIADLDGNLWMIATHKAEPTEAQMREAMQKEMAQAASQAREAAATAAAGSESEY
jgi:uncharacterized glyoxalase superfamily protein PhnB